MSEPGGWCEDDTMHCAGDSEVEDGIRKKRFREEEQYEEEWHTVSRDSKRKQRGQNINNLEEKSQVCVTHTEVLPKQFALAKLFRNHGIVGVTRVKYINPFKILVDFDKDDNAEKLISHQGFKMMGWRIQKTWEVGVSYGMVRDIELEITCDELIQNIISEEAIISMKRLNRRLSDGSWTPSEKLRIGFVGSKLPTYIHLHQLRIRVEPFVFPVTQCSRCWRYGHLVRMCPSNRIRCPKCGDNHDNCDRTSYKCCNCGGGHLSLSKSCPVFIKEKRIRQLMSEFNCSYNKALTLYVPPSPPPMPRNKEKTSQDTSSCFYTYASAASNSKENPTAEKDSTNGENVKTPNEKPKKQRRKKKTKIYFRDGNKNEEMEWLESEAESEASDSNIRDVNTGAEPSKDTGKKTKNERDGLEWQMYLKVLLDKLKEVVFSGKDETWIDKIKRGIKCFSQWFKAVFQDILTKIPVIKDLVQMVI